MPRKTTGFAAAVACLLLVTLLPFGEWAVYLVERRVQAPQVLPQHVTGIVLLGGGETREAYTSDGGIQKVSVRLAPFAALAKRYPRARLVITGGRGDLGVSEAENLRSQYAQLGLPPGRLTLEIHSNNTFENAVFTRQKMHPRPDEVWLLVTSAAHMPRSVRTFRHAGWNVVPYPVAYKVASMPTLQTRHSVGEEMNLLRLAGHEVAGLLLYRMRGQA